MVAFNQMDVSFHLHEIANLHTVNHAVSALRYASSVLQTAATKARRRIEGQKQNKGWLQSSAPEAEAAGAEHAAADAAGSV